MSGRDREADTTKGRERMRERYLKYGGKDGKGVSAEDAHRLSGDVARRVERKENERKGG